MVIELLEKLEVGRNEAKSSSGCRTADRDHQRSPPRRRQVVDQGVRDGLQLAPVMGSGEVQFGAECDVEAEVSAWPVRLLTPEY